MQAVRGYINNGRFTPHEAVALPKRAEVTLLFDEAGHVITLNDDKAFWVEFDRMTSESSHENSLLLDEAFSRRDSGRDMITFRKEIPTS